MRRLLDEGKLGTVFRFEARMERWVPEVAAGSVYAEIGLRRANAKTDDDVLVALTHRSGVHSHWWMSLARSPARGAGAGCAGASCGRRRKLLELRLTTTVPDRTTVER